MPIHNLFVENFKGIARPTTFEIRPLTIFLGANSSGKSTCLHALAALAQTLKLGNSAPTLILDDDYAHVHLGRFIEIAHSRKYSDPINLGINIGPTTIHTLSPDKNYVEGDCTAAYSFKSTLRTQEVFIDSARITVGAERMQIKRGSKLPYKFTAIAEQGGQKYEAERTSNYLFRLMPGNAPPKDEINNWLEALFFLENAQQQVERAIRDILYLGPFRQSPLRRYPFRGSTASEVGPQGEATITMLASEFVQAQDRPHLKQINSWLSELNLAKNLDLARVGTSDLFDVKLTLTDGHKLPIADLGYGLSQILPVLAQCSFAPLGSTLLFEQPELHLHEGAARKLAQVFHETATKKEAHLVIETHSKEFIQEVFQLIRSDALKVEDLAIYIVERRDGASQYKRVGMQYEDGHLEVNDPWVHTLTA